jgi:hypothetical protein
MKEMTMLDLSAIDLGDLVLALEDHSELGSSWWIDANTGELREVWFRFHDTRMRRRAIEFLADEGLVEDEAAGQLLDELVDPPVGEERPANPHSVAEAVAGELRGLYGDHLVGVMLYGSDARGDAHPDSDVDLAVILDQMESPWEEPTPAPSSTQSRNGSAGRADQRAARAPSLPSAGHPHRQRLRSAVAMSASATSSTDRPLPV